MFLNRVYCCLLFCFTSAVVMASTDNIAPTARVSVSTALTRELDGSKAVDGVIGVDGAGEWACDGVLTSWGDMRFPWLQLTWTDTQTVDRIVLYDRANGYDNIAGGKLLFSDGSVIWVNQLPPDGTGKELRFPSKKITWVRFQVTDGEGKDLGLSEIEVFQAPEQARDYVALVDPYIETNRGRYFYFITGSLPFGMATSAPMTRNKNQNGGGYNYNQTEVLGFEQVHSWMMSGIELMPATTNEDPSLGQQGWKSKFNHDDEIVQPGYHRLMLQRNKIRVEQTATERVSFYKFTYTRDAAARIIINLSGLTGNAVMKNAEVRKISNSEFEGSVSTVDRFWGGPEDVKVFFVIRFSRPFAALEAWEGKTYRPDADKASGDTLRLGARYDLEKNEEVKVQIALSYTTVQNARKNLDAELPHWDFEKIRNQAREIWNTQLGKIEIKGGTVAQRIKFYTDLWHVLLGRQKINDVNGDYPDRTQGPVENKFTDALFKIRTIPKDAAGKPRFNMYNSDAWWLSQWNLNVLWGLAWPEVMDEMSASMIEYANNGYLLPRGPCGGGYSYIMTSCPATNLIVSTYMKGLLTKQTAANAYKVIRQNHLPGGMLGSKEDIAFYTDNGWWPDNVGVGVEATFQDWGIAQMAYKLGKKQDFNFFLKRSRNWEMNFDPRQKLLFPKDRKGNFTNTDPLNGAGWIESNAWQATWGVSHAIPELAKKMGGNDSLCDKLNFAFEQARSTDFVYAYSGGYISYANQPGCSNAHVFSYAGKPWLTQYWVRRVQEQAYSHITPDLGYGGHDEDQGQMGGVSALMAIGLFNIQGNQAVTPVYEITAPVFDEVSILLDKRYYSGDRFTIRTHNNSNLHCYIRKAALNGRNWDQFWFTHNDFQKGGVLDIWLDAAPNKEWGRGALPPQIK